MVSIMTARGLEVRQLTTLKDAREKDKSITREDVEKVSGKMLKRKKRAVRIVLKAPHKHFEYQ